MKKLMFLVFLLAFFLPTLSQTPTDYLPKEFHKERRDILRGKMPPNSVAVVFANPLRNRSNDVDFVFHQDPNFYYLTGYREPNAVLIMFSDYQADKNGNTYNEILYVQKRDKKAELWNGKRLGVDGAKKVLGFKTAINAEEFITNNINFQKFDKVFVHKIKDDFRDLNNNKADVHDLVKAFKKKSFYEKIINKNSKVEYFKEKIANVPDREIPDLALAIKNSMKEYPELKSDNLITDYVNVSKRRLRKEIRQKIRLQLKAKPKENIDLWFLHKNLATMRETKTAQELKLLTKAIRISAIGQIEVMKAMKPHMSETELQGIHEFVYKKYGAEYEGYPSIVGSGNNGCILHYIENNRTKVANDLVLMDLGAEYRGYTADVTRTIPANGKFTKEQKEIYDLVYEAQEAGIALYKIGADMRAPGLVARKIINRGLKKLGIIKSIFEEHNYFPHGTSHHIGLDVHDPGNYKNFEENMVVTMEPGIYIPDGSPCDKKYWGIGVRIEDDILVTKNGPVNLSDEAPRTTEEIEKMMAKKSVLDEFVLPNLD